MNPIVAQIPTELLDLYRVLVQNAPNEQVAHFHLVNFLADAKAIVSAVQAVYDAAQARSTQ